MSALEMRACLADRAWLTRRYVSDRASIRAIAAELGCSTYPVIQALIRHGIPRRAPGDHARDAGQQTADQLGDRDFLLRRYATDRMTIQQIADLVGCGVSRVRRALADHEIPVRWVGRRASRSVDRDWLARRYLEDLASTRDIAEELGCSAYAVTQALIRYGIPLRPVGSPKGRPARHVQVARLQQLSTRQLQQILVEADTDADAATTLGVSRAALRQVIVGVGIDKETVIRQRSIRRQTAAWPALLHDRDRLAEALNASTSISAVARRAGCSRESVIAAASYHQIPRVDGRRRQRAPSWTAQLPAPPAPPDVAPDVPRDVADTEPLGIASGQLHDANARRSRSAAARTVDAARELLEDWACPAQHRVVLQARVDHPQASLAELGALLGTTKDAYAAMLRRALAGR